MTEFRTGKAVVRIHGEADREQIENATIKLAKEIVKCRKEKKSKTSS